MGYTMVKDLSIPHYPTRIDYQVQGKAHRVNGPAAEWDTGDWFWYYNGVAHRYYGPASSVRLIYTTKLIWEIHGTRIKQCVL